LPTANYRLLERPENLKLLLPQRNGRDVAIAAAVMTACTPGRAKRGGVNQFL